MPKKEQYTPEQEAALKEAVFATEEAAGEIGQEELKKSEKASMEKIKAEAKRKKMRAELHEIAKKVKESAKKPRAEKAIIKQEKDETGWDETLKEAETEMEWQERKEEGARLLKKYEEDKEQQEWRAIETEASERIRRENEKRKARQAILETAAKKERKRKSETATTPWSERQTVAMTGEIDTKPFSDLEEKFFEEGRRMTRGAYQKSELVKPEERAAMFEKALQSVPTKKLAEIEYFSEAKAIKTAARDIDARHKMAPNVFPHTSSEILGLFNKAKYMEAEINRITGLLTELMSMAAERKKKSGFWGRFFGLKKRFLEPDENEEYKNLELDLKAAMINYKKTHKEYKKIFHPLRDLAESGTVAMISPRRLTSPTDFPRIKIAGIIGQW